MTFYLLGMAVTLVCSSEPHFPKPIAYREVVPHVETAIQRVDPNMTRAMILRNDGVFDLTTLENAESLTILRVYGGELVGFSSLRKLPRLKEVQFVGCSIKDIEWVTELSQLEHIGLALNEIEEFPSLENMKDLRVLDLSQNRIQAFASDGPPLAPALQRVDLRGNPLSEDAVNMIPEDIDSGVRLFTRDIAPQDSDNSSRNLQVRSRWMIAQYSLQYRLTRYKELAGPQFERGTPDGILEAADLLDRLGDDSYLTDFATVVLCYCLWAREMNPPGWPIADKYIDAETGEMHVQTGHGYVLEKLCRGVELEGRGDVITSNFLGSYLTSKRMRFGPSLPLSDYVEQW